MREKLKRRTAVWIVAIVQNFADDRFRLSILCFSNSFFGQFYSALAKTGDRVLMSGAGKISDRDPKLLVRQGIIFLGHRLLTSRQRFVTMWHRGFAPLNFAGLDPVHILPETR